MQILIQSDQDSNKIAFEIIRHLKLDSLKSIKWFFLLKYFFFKTILYTFLIKNPVKNMNMILFRLTRLLLSYLLVCSLKNMNSKQLDF